MLLGRADSCNISFWSKLMNSKQALISKEKWNTLYSKTDFVLFLTFCHSERRYTQIRPGAQLS